jgi:NAD(P)-dependent dehydrogenase (short-subunit alcohol dehydrogenase family)
MKLKNQNVLVVGGSTGIGFAVAEAAAREGANLILLARDLAKLKTAQSRLGGETRILSADYLQKEELVRAMAELPVVHHIVLSASSQVAWGPFRDLTADRLISAFQGKLIGYVQAIQAVLPRLDPQGSITLVTGAASRAGIPNTSGVAAVNGAISQMAHTLSKELAPIRVNVVSPGMTETPAYDGIPEAQRREMFRSTAAQLPVGRIGQPEDIALGALMLMQNPFATGVILDLDGGLRG